MPDLLEALVEVRLKEPSGFFLLARGVLFRSTHGDYGTDFRTCYNVNEVSAAPVPRARLNLASTALTAPRRALTIFAACSGV